MTLIPPDGRKRIIGVPREIKPQEHRVALVPSWVHTLVADGHSVLVEEDAVLCTEYLYGICMHVVLAGLDGWLNPLQDARSRRSIPFSVFCIPR